jgi:hypothetical protein
VNATVRAAHTRLRHLAYQAGLHGRLTLSYPILTGRWAIMRAGYTGTTAVPWKHPGYWNENGTSMEDGLRLTDGFCRRCLNDVTPCRPPPRDTAIG